MTPAPADPIDAETLSRIEEMELMGARGLVAQVLAAYLKESPVNVGRIEHAFTEDDADEMVRASHILASSSATVGALSLASLCREAEGLGRAGDVSSSATLVRALRIEFEVVRRALEARLSALG